MGALIVQTRGKVGDFLKNIAERLVIYDDKHNQKYVKLVFFIGFQFGPPPNFWNGDSEENRKTFFGILYEIIRGCPHTNGFTHFSYFAPFLINE